VPGRGNDTAMDPVDRTALQAAGLYDPDAPDAAQRLELLEYLISVGWRAEELARNADRLMSLASRRVLFGGEERISVARLAELAGCDEALVRRVRLAAGLPDPGDAAVCSPLEVGVMASFAMGAAVLGEDEALQFTRVLGTAASGIAEAALAAFAANRTLPMLEEGGTPAEVARAGAEATVALLSVPPVLDVLLRVHFEAANTGRFGGEHGSPTVRVAVAFVDLVGSTQLTQTLTGSELASALGDFERAASDVVVEVGGRVVKRIGDAVMFVASDAAAACDAALAIVAAVDEHPLLTAARAAVAFGRVLPRDGDYFGTPVNLAARAVAIADPGMVVVNAEARDTLAAGGRSVTPLGEHTLKGFDDPVALFDVSAVPGTTFVPYT
jgi:class 3 adenylate cyclase